MSMADTHREGARILFARYGSDGSTFTQQELEEVAAQVGAVGEQGVSGIRWVFRQMCRANGLHVTRPRINPATQNREIKVTTNPTLIRPDLKAELLGIGSRIVRAAEMATIMKPNATAARDVMTVNYALGLNDYVHSDSASAEYSLKRLIARDKTFEETQAD